eukprot:375773_1
MRSLWFYNLCVSTATCFDWIMDIVVLIELTTWHNDAHWYYFGISLAIQIIARCISPFWPLKWYNYRSKNKYKICTSILLSFFFSPILQFYHTIIDNKLSNTLLHWKLSKNQQWLQDNCHYSKFQTYTHNALQVNSINAVQHGIFQTFPQMILLQIILLAEDHTYDDNEFIWLKFFISLGTLMLLSPIYCNWFYYWQLNGNDHYDIYTFLFVPLAVCCDLLFLHYILSFLAFRDVYTPSLNWTFITDPSWKIIESLWYWIMFYVLIIISITFIVALTAILIWIIYTIIFTDDLQCNCGLCSYCIIGWIALIFIVPIVIIIMFLCLTFFNMIWLVLLTQFMIQKLPLPKVELWEQTVYWLKEYKDWQDLRLRLISVNYHILKDINIRNKLQCEIDSYCNDKEYRLTFTNIRRICNIKSDKKLLLQIWHLFEWGGVIVDRITLILLLVFGPIYFLTRICTTVLPIIGFSFNHYLFENSVVCISLVYIIWFIGTMTVLPMVVWHFYIWYHIAPGMYNLDTHGLFYSYLPKKDKIYAIRMSYNNALKGINWSEELNKYFSKDIVDVIIEYIPGTLFVDYCITNIAEDCQPLTQQQDNQETVQLNKMEIGFQKIATTDSASESH